jgi:hypothetical protein
MTYKQYNYLSMMELHKTPRKKSSLEKIGIALLKTLVTILGVMILKLVKLD